MPVLPNAPDSGSGGATASPGRSASRFACWRRRFGTGPPACMHVAAIVLPSSRPGLSGCSKSWARCVTVPAFCRAPDQSGPTTRSSSIPTVSGNTSPAERKAHRDPRPGFYLRRHLPGAWLPGGPGSRKPGSSTASLAQSGFLLQNLVTSTRRFPEAQLRERPISGETMRSETHA